MRLIFLILLTLLITGCGSSEFIKDSMTSISSFIHGGEDNSEPPSPLIEFPSEIKINVLWSESVGKGANEKSLKLVPAIASSKIIAADSTGLVQARDLATGKLLWESESTNHYSGGPGIGITTVILGTSDAEVIALDIENGQPLWKSSVSTEVLSVPVIDKGIVVIRTTDGGITALDEKTGGKLWSYEHNVPSLTVRGTGNPLIYGGNVIAGYDNGKLIALLLSNGKDVWEANLAIPKGRSEIERLVDLDVDPIEAGGVIYIASYNGGISAISNTDGEVQWRNEKISSSTGLVADAGHLFLSDSRSNVWKLEQSNGNSLWQHRELTARHLTAPAVYQNYVVLGDFEGYLHWLSTVDGRQLAHERIAKSPIDAKPVVVNGIVYVYANDGTLAAIAAGAK